MRFYKCKSTFFVCLMFFSLFAALCRPFPSFAEDVTEDTGQSIQAGEGENILYVYSKYSSAIRPAEGDYFTISFNSDSTQKSSEITVDAYLADGSLQSFSLPYGDYTVTGIQYTGANPDISEQGYGTWKNFLLSENSDDTLCIYVGASRTSELEREYNVNSFIVDAEHYGQRNVFRDENDEIVAYEVTLDDGRKDLIYVQDPGASESVIADETDDTYDSDFDQTENSNIYEPSPETTGAGEKVIVEYPETETSNTSFWDTPLSGVALVLFVGVIGGCVIFLLHKMGRF